MFLVFSFVSVHILADIAIVEYTWAFNLSKICENLSQTRKLKKGQIYGPIPKNKDEKHALAG